VKKELEDALRAVAARQGRQPEELLAELLHRQLDGGSRAVQTEAPVVAQQVEVLPRGHQMPVQAPPAQPQQYQQQHYQPQPYQPQPPPVQMQAPQRYAGVPAPKSEADIEVLMRYLEAESGPSGVFGDGGMSAGGVFGSAPVATAGYDPAGEHRAASHALAQSVPQLIHALQQQATQPRYHQAPPPPQPVRMVTHTTTTIYEGPGHLPAPPQQPMPMLPWWRQR
jgi:hypothetical protein